MPLRCRLETSPRENCDQVLDPSPLLMISVLTPWRCACASIEDTLPPLELDITQIHMPRVNKGLKALALAGASAITAVAASAATSARRAPQRLSSCPRCGASRPRLPRSSVIRQLTVVDNPAVACKFRFSARDVTAPALWPADFDLRRTYARYRGRLCAP